MRAHIGMLALAALCMGAPGWAQYTGPSGSTMSVKQLLESGRDRDPVALKGYIVSQVPGKTELYQFNDGTAGVLIKIGRKDWPQGLKVDEKTLVEIAGKYDLEYLEPVKVKVTHLRLAK